MRMGLYVFVYVFVYLLDVITKPKNHILPTTNQIKLFEQHIRSFMTKYYVATI